MELKLVILSLACLSCLAPPVYGHPILAAKLAAAGALKGAALIGVGALAKGAILKGAALLAAKGAVLGGAALLGAKALKAGAALKAAALAAAKPALLPSSVVVQKPVLVEVAQPSVVISPPSLSNIGEKLNGLLTATKDAVINKTTAVGELLASLLPSKTIVKPAQPVVYQIVSAPKFYPVPIIEKIVKKK